ncbi:hypothetical protein J6590_089755 [Homalodisca vitripennis]|nr:hypothetical protein J6590_089755 [Homalodisca vitripennis]
MPRLPVLLRKRIQQLCGQPEPARSVVEEHQRETGRCVLCPRAKNRKSRTRCPQCQRFICREHTSFACVTCAAAEGDVSDTDDDE